MSLSHDSFTFFSNPEGVIQVVQPHQPAIAVGAFFGVIGESHIIGEPQGADLACEYRFQNYNTIATLRSAEKTLEANYGKLTGTLTQTISGNTREYKETTFIGFRAFEAPFLDGSGAHGWVMRGILLWRQRRRG